MEEKEKMVDGRGGRDEGRNIIIHVTIENHYHGTIDHLTINGD